MTNTLDFSKNATPTKFACNPAFYFLFANNLCLFMTDKIKEEAFLNFQSPKTIFSNEKIPLKNYPSFRKYNPNKNLSF